MTARELWADTCALNTVTRDGVSQREYDEYRESLRDARWMGIHLATPNELEQIRRERCASTTH